MIAKAKDVIGLIVQPWPYLTTFGRFVYVTGALLAIGIPAAVIWIFARGVGSILGGC